MNLEEVKQLFKERFGKFLTGVGVGDGKIKAYIKDGSLIAVLPYTFEGYEVECIVTGETRIL